MNVSLSQEYPVKVAFESINRMCQVGERDLLASFDEIDFIVFPRGIIFRTGFALSSDCQQIARSLRGHSASNQRVPFVGILSWQPCYCNYCPY